MSGAAGSDVPTGAPLRILLVSNMWPTDGDPVFGVFVKRQADALRALGHDVEVVANTDSTGGPVAALRKYGPLLSRSRAAAARGGFDAVVGHFLYPTAFIARAAAKRAGCPFVLVAHGTDVSSLQRGGPVAAMSRSALPHAALVVAVSSALEARLRTELALPSATPTAAVHMGVDLDVFSPRPEARSALAWPADERVALFAGNLAPVKGLDVLLDAFARLVKDGACDRLVLIGSGLLHEALRAQAASLGVGERVELTGRLSGADVALRMAAADVFVLPSRNEGLGVVLLEAMACGTPCVGSAVGGIPEALRAPECGRLVPPGDPDALAAAMAEVLAEGRASFTEACVAAASGQGTLSQAARFVEAVRSAIGGGAA